MTKLYLILFSSILLLFLCSCDSATPPSLSKSAKKNTQVTPKDIPDSSQNPSIVTELDQLEAQRGNPNRTIWQQPKMIIQQLGNLKEKTVADIGAGPFGYFSFQIAQNAKKVIAIDIDKNALAFIDSMRQELLPKGKKQAIETRLAASHNPKLKTEEVDVVVLMNIYAYLPNQVTYLETIKKGMKDNAQLLIIDFKMRKLPIGPRQNEKVPLYIVERELEAAGFRLDVVDDRTLDYQYMVMATKVK